ncbi:hypothetical protein Tco_0812061 [Tanacetum coccineum]
MGMDTVQLETAVSTISQEYLLEFMSEYGISEGLHPKLPGRGDRIIDFSEGKVGVYTKFFEFANFRIPISQFLFDILGHYQIHLSQLSRTSAPKDRMPAEDTYSTEDVVLLNTRRTPIQKQSELLLCLVGLSRIYYLGDDVYPTFLYDDGREMDLFNLISAPNPAIVKTGTRQRAAHEVSTCHGRSGYRHGGRGCDVDLVREILSEGRGSKLARRDQRIQARDEDIKKLDEEVKSLRVVEAEVHGLRNQARNLETLLEAEVDMKKVVEAKNVDLAGELEILRAQLTDLQVSNQQLSLQVSSLQCKITGEEKIKSALEFRKLKDEKVERRCAEMDARLDALSVDFDEELYPHMLTAIAGHRWVIGHGLRLAVMKCAEFAELWQGFADVVSAGIAKGMSEGLKHGVEHRKAQLDLEVINAYDPEADAKFTTALQALKDLKYPLVDQLEQLKDAPIDLIMASLHLESDTGEDAPSFIRDLLPNSSQLKIPVYPEVRDPVGSVHHARSDGIPVFVPIVAPQGL